MGKLLFISLITISAALLSAGIHHTFQGPGYSQSQFIPHSSHLLYSKWKSLIGRVYLSPSENNFRLKNFYDSIHKLIIYRRENPEGIYGLSEFADLTDREFMKMMLNTDLKDSTHSTQQVFNLKNGEKAKIAKKDHKESQSKFES